jgi:radical SAM superfamily enzyme YgiQ (UPF0313 family)
MARALLINPWIYDFSAFDLWAQPLGLLGLAGLLRTGGWEVDYVDCTDRWHPVVADEKLRRQPFNVGKYFATEVPKPPPLARIPRRFKRYGVPLEAIESDLCALERPDVILVTSRMTYWYPGVVDAVRICRRVFGGVPIILGGIYATLCRVHAESICRPDIVFAGEAESSLPGLLETACGYSMRLPLSFGHTDGDAKLDALPTPAYDLMRRSVALPYETSRGCPYRCSYCATGSLHPSHRVKSPEHVVDELQQMIEIHGAEDIAFYDDALLLNPEAHFLPIAAEFCRRKLSCRFHTPNGLFAHMITPEVAQAMRSMEVETVRVSLESVSSDRLRQWNRRVGPGHFTEAMRNLREAGFRREQIGVYLLCAMPGQTFGEVRDTVNLVLDHGGTPRLCEYSPIPGTEEWQRAVAGSGLPLETEPLLHNNSIYHIVSGAMNREEFQELKLYVRERVGQGPEVWSDAFRR